MALNKPNQQLRRDLKAAASALDDVAHDLACEAQTHGHVPQLAVAGCSHAPCVCKTAVRLAQGCQ